MSVPSREKINSRYFMGQSSHPNDLYRYFSKILKPMVASENPGPTSPNPDDWYVPNLELQEKVEVAVQTPLNERIMLVGHTGIGKSAFIRHFFSASANPRIEDQILYLPYYFDPVSVDNQTNGIDLIQPKVQAACKKLQLHNNINFNHDLFFNFINGHRSDILYPNDLPFDATEAERINSLQQNRPYQYYAELLKFFVVNSPIKKIVIIIDDIDTVEPVDLQARIIASAARFTYCLHNIYHEDEGHPSINPDSGFQTLLLISCRPNTRSNLSRSEVLKGMPFERSIELDAPVSLEDLFEARFNATLANPNLSEQLANRAQFTEYKNILNDVLASISEINQRFFLGINNFDVRNSLEVMQKVLSNRRYVQQSRPVQQHFILNRNDFRINTANVVRAIALGESRVYNPKNSPIKNILVNSRFADSDLIGIYLINILTRGSKIHDFSLDGVHFKEDDLIASLERLFDSTDQAPVIMKRLQEFKDWEILSTEQFQSKGGSENLIHLTPRGAVLWNELRERSFLLEFFRDDVYLPISSDDDNVWPLLFEPVEELEQVDRIGSALRLIDSYSKKELRLFSRKAEQSELGWLREIVDGNSISKMMFSGVDSSIRRIYVSRNQEMPHVIREARRKVSEKVDKAQSVLMEENN